MFDIRYTFRKRNEKEIQESKLTLGADGNQYSFYDLAMAVLKLYAKRDIDIISVKVLYYIPTIFNVSINDDGQMLLNGKEVDIEKLPKNTNSEPMPLHSFFSLIGGNTNIPSQVQPPVVLREMPIQQTQPQTFIQQSQPQTLRENNKPQNANQEQEISQSIGRKKIVMPKGLKGAVEIGVENWAPSDSEKSQGIQKISVYNPPKKMIFDPPMGSDVSRMFPIPHGSEVMLFEIQTIQNQKFPRGEKMALIQHKGSNYLLPELMFIEAPLFVNPEIMPSGQPNARYSMDGSQINSAEQQNIQPNQTSQEMGPVPILRRGKSGI